MKKYKLTALLLGLILMAGLLLPGCAPEPTEPAVAEASVLDIPMYYTEVTEEGMSLADPKPCHLLGKLTLYTDGSRRMDMESFTFEEKKLFFGKQWSTVTQLEEGAAFHIWAVRSIGSSSTAGNSIFFDASLSCAVINTGIQYFVCSTDPAANPAEIFARFRDDLDQFTKTVDIPAKLPTT